MSMAATHTPRCLRHLAWTRSARRVHTDRQKRGTQQRDAVGSPQSLCSDKSFMRAVVLSVQLSLLFQATTPQRDKRLLALLRKMGLMLHQVEHQQASLFVGDRAEGVEQLLLIRVNLLGLARLARGQPF